MSDTQVPSTLIDADGSRRSFLRRSALLSGAAVALLGGVPLRGIAAHNDAQASSDVNILNVALGLEHEGIAAYQIGAVSGLLDKPTLAVGAKVRVRGLKGSINGTEGVTQKWNATKSKWMVRLDGRNRALPISETHLEKV